MTQKLKNMDDYAYSKTIDKLNDYIDKVYTQNLPDAQYSINIQ